MLSSNQFCMKSAITSANNVLSVIQIPFSSVIHSAFKFGILPITGTLDFIDSNGNVPNPLSSSIQTLTKQSLSEFENSLSDRPLKSLKVNHLYCGNFK